MKKVNSILDFDDSSLIEKINQELKRVVENITDINTNTKAREINVKLILTPDERRKHISMKANVNSKLQQKHAVETSMQISVLEDGITAIELTGQADGQKDLFGNIHETKIVSLKKGEN